jgi:hypothetical protein
MVVSEDGTATNLYPCWINVPPAINSVPVFPVLQTTLEEATDLLKQFEEAQFEETQDSPSVAMETGGENMEGIDGDQDGNDNDGE